MRPRVVICGSFHRNLVGLKRLFRELEMTGCRILSPISLDFADTSTTIVKTTKEDEYDINDLEKFHLRAIKDADLIWLHAPDGYVGLSTAFEIGYGRALHKTIFTNSQLSDEMLRTQTTVVRSVFES